jgi:hypothetical protein
VCTRPNASALFAAGCENLQERWTAAACAKQPEARDDRRLVSPKRSDDLPTPGLPFVNQSSDDLDGRTATVGLPLSDNSVHRLFARAPASRPRVAAVEARRSSASRARPAGWRTPGVNRQLVVLARAPAPQWQPARTGGGVLLLDALKRSGRGRIRSRRFRFLVMPAVGERLSLASAVAREEVARPTLERYPSFTRVAQ